MKKKINSAGFKAAASVLVSLMLGIFIAAVTENGTSPLSDMLGVILTPFESCASKITQELSDVRLGFVSSQKYREENESLRDEIEKYRERLVEYEKNEKKMDAYEEFLGLKEEHPDYTFTSASVISRKTDDIYGTFTVDRGRKDGITVNCPVIFGSALIGIVTEVGETSSTVCTPFNPNVNISVYEIMTRLDCILESDNLLTMQGKLKLTGLTDTTSIVPGGIIATSGVGGKYPPDLLVGTVTEIIKDETSSSVYALIEPETDYDSVRDVFILTDFDK